MGINCKKCNVRPENESEIEVHHIIPKCIGGSDVDGRINLCVKDHHIIHNMLPALIWKFLPMGDRSACIKYIREWTNKNYRKFNNDGTKRLQQNVFKL